jgi:hypothetical protein
MVFVGRAGGGRTDLVPSHPPRGAGADLVQFADVPESDSAAAVRRSKLEHIWLLLLRCLCLLLLAVGFARPFFARDISPPTAAAQERRLILLVDTSASMRREVFGKRRAPWWTEYLDKATPSDQVAVMTFDLQPRTLVSFADWSSWPQDQRAVLARQRLAAVAPGWMGTHLGLA